MAEPTTYTPDFDFTATDKGTQLNVELQNISGSTGSLAAAISDVRRSDGALQNGIVTADSLTAGLKDELASGAISQAAASATSAAGSATAADADATAAAASAAAASTDADDAAASAAAAAATLASSLKKADNLSDLASAPTALTNLGLTATAAEINTLDGITASTAELNLLDGVTVTTAQINSIAQFTGRNLIINGSGRINQRGYVSGAATSVANQFTLDRWFVVTSGQNLSWTGDASARIMTAPAGGVSQVIEGANIVGGTYVLNWTGAATATVGGVARTKGETFTLTANTNVTVTFTSGTFTDVQLERGSAVTPFEHRSIGQELALCQRYYWRGLPAGHLNGNGHAADAVISFPVAFSGTMRAMPTITSNFTGATLANAGSVSVSVPTVNGCRLLFMTTGATISANIQFAAGNYIAADAELTS